jgi:hypothetical protein
MGACTCNEREEDQSDPETDFDLRLNLLKSYILLTRPRFNSSSAFQIELCDFQSQDTKSTDGVTWPTVNGSATGVVNKSNNLSTQPPAKCLSKAKAY